MHNGQDQHTALADVALQMLTKEFDRYTLHPRAEEGLKAGMNALFENPELDPRAEVESLLKLGWILETDHASIEVSDVIIGVLAKDERALSVLGLSNGLKGRDVSQQFTQFADKEAHAHEAP